MKSEEAKIQREAVKQIDLKKCIDCGSTKKIELFPVRRDSKDGRRNSCQECQSKKQRERKADPINYEKDRLYQIEYRKDPENIARIKKVKHDYQIKYRKTEHGRRRMCEMARLQKKKDPEKNNARSHISYAVSTGKIKSMPCQRCGTLDDIQAHHWDYSQPLNVMWLCRKHHSDLHKGRF